MLSLRASRATRAAAVIALLVATATPALARETGAAVGDPSADPVPAAGSDTTSPRLLSQARRRGLVVKGLRRELTVAPGETTPLRVRVRTSSGKPVVGYRFRTAYQHYSESGRASEELVTTAVTDAQGRATLGVHVPFTPSTVFPYDYTVTLRDARDRVVGSRDLEVTVDHDLLEADPAATCEGDYPAPSVPTVEQSSFYLVSAVPCDVPGADQTTALRRLVRSTDLWFTDQTKGGVTPRWARDEDGAVTVLRVAVPFTRHQFGQAKGYKDTVSWLRKNLADSEALIPVILLDSVSDDGYCGVTQPRPLQKLILIPQAEEYCQSYPEEFGDGGAYPVVMHEMVHAMGAVASCAPHYDGTGHVDVGKHDLLYNGPGYIEAPVVLDEGRDDYYLHDNKDCPDIADSLFWTTGQEASAVVR